jgi:hypothetical protein
MAEIGAAELRRLRGLEARIVTARDNLADVRARRDQYRSEAVAARRELREASRDRDRLETQVDELVAANAAMAEALERANADLTVVGAEAKELRAEGEVLRKKLDGAVAELAEARKLIKGGQEDRARLEKQLDNATGQLKGEVPPELTPDQLSHLLGRFIDQVGSQTGLRLSGTRLNLKVGFTGRGGGSFVVPTADMDPKDLPGLQDIVLDLSPAALELGDSLRPDEPS